MDKVRQLIIRACKSNNPNLRVRQVYRRFYGRYSRTEESFSLVQILSQICDHHLDVPVASLITDLMPENGWKFGVTDDDSYCDGAVKILVSRIRLGSIDDYPGLRPPAKFRNYMKSDRSAFMMNQPVTQQERL